MSTKTLSSRLDRHEGQFTQPDPPQFTIVAVRPDLTVAGRYRLTDSGLVEN